MSQAREAAARQPKQRSLRFRFITVQVGILVITMVGVAAAQWVLSYQFGEKRIEKAFQEADQSINRLVDERLLTPQTLGMTFARNPEMGVAFHLLDKENDETLFLNLVDPAIDKLKYGVIALNAEGKEMYVAGYSRSRHHDLGFNYQVEFSTVQPGHYLTIISVKEDLYEFHFMYLIGDSDKIYGILDVVAYLDNQFAYEVALAAGHQIAFLDETDKAVVASLTTIRGIRPKKEEIISGTEYRIHIGTVAIEDQPRDLRYALFVDTSSLTKERLTIFWSTLGIVGCVALIAFFIGTYASRSVTQPLELMASQSKEIAQGNYSTRLDFQTPLTEISEIRNSFNAMTAAIDKAMTELENANRRLQELDQLKSSFLSSVSHELRTPLTSVLGFAKLIGKDFRKNFIKLVEDDKKLSKRAYRINDNLDIIIHEGERLTRLINDVLDLAKIESGRMDYRDEAFPAVEFIKQAVQAASGQFTNKPAVSLMVDVPEDLPKIEVDRDKLIQVVINLLNNAAKFTDEGSVSVKAVLDDDQWLRISVTDTGPGIPAADLDKVFDKFHQVKSSDTLEDKPKGTGLGLAICSQIVEHYGGRIWVESVLGEGSSFIFTLPTLDASPRMVPAEPEQPEVAEKETEAEPEVPARDEPEPKPEPPPAVKEEPPPEDAKTVLVLSQFPDIQSELDRIWSQEGFRVISTLPGEPARQAVEDYDPDLVTLDWPKGGIGALSASGLDSKREENPPVIVTPLPRGSRKKSGGPDNLEDMQRALLANLETEKTQPRINLQPCLIVDSGDGNHKDPPRDVFHGPLIYCNQEELLEILEDGFEGSIFFSSGQIHEAPLKRLAGWVDIDIYFLP